METQKLSFTFSKQKRPPVSLVKQSTPNVEKRNQEREYITSIEDRVINSTKPVEKHLIIPLIQSQHGIRKRIRSMNKTQSISSDPLTQQAVRELQAEANQSQDGDRMDDDFVISLKKPNPMLPQDTSQINYDAVPVEKFGLAILAGMGFNPDDLKTSINETTGPVRPKGLGLGADPHAAKAAKQQSQEDSKEKLSWRAGARCQSILGKHKGLYGTVDGLDGDTGRVIVKLTLSKEVAPILQPMLRLVTEKEYSKYSTCINQEEVDRYKAKEAEMMQQSQHGSTHERIAERNDDLQHTGSKHRSVQKSVNRHSWVRPNLMVKFLDKYYEGGKYYKEKVVVIKTHDSGFCTCQTSLGNFIHDVNPRYLQTVVPRENGTRVMILHGPRDGEMAKLVEQRHSKNEVDLRTRAGTMIQLTFDQVCAVSQAP